MIMIDNKKYLYLITFGGLNDTINQIMLGYKYCIPAKRNLVIDTTHSRQERDIQNYFYLKNKIIFQNSKSYFAKHAKLMQIYPPCNLDSLKFTYDATAGNMVSNGTSFAIDLKDDRKEDILVFGDCRLNGRETNEFFKLFPMKENVKIPLQKRYNSLPPDYISVHIRNTDYQSDVSTFIEKNKDNFAKKSIFLASDNTKSIAEFKNKIDANIYTFSNIPTYINDPELGIHKYKVDNKEELNIESIVDLVILSLGKEIFRSCPYSGYSNNAIVMNADNEFKNNVLSQLKNNHEPLSSSKRL